MSSNGISGTLPPFTGLTKLTTLELDGNELGGDLPSNLLENTSRGSDRVELLLSNNKFTGLVPSSWSRFSRLVVDLSGNQITGIGDGLCALTGWMDGTVLSFTCDAILCPAGSYNDFGRQTSSAASCQPCSTAQFFGTKDCDGDGKVDDAVVGILKDFYAATQGSSWINNAGWSSTEKLL